MTYFNRLPQNIAELSSITQGKYPVDKWDGAVVMLVVDGHFALIRRSYNMPTHKGQIGFMGGHRQSGEFEPYVTAQREFFEESGFDGSRIKCLGLVEPVYTVRMKLIIPVVAEFDGSKAEFLKNVRSNGEWENLVLVPIEHLETSEMWTKCISKDRHAAVYFHPLLTSICTYYRKPKKVAYVLWGASAKMIVNFFKN